MLGKFLKFFERKSDAYGALLGIGMQTAANIAAAPNGPFRTTALNM
jgi:hypothetical protein